MHSALEVSLRDTRILVDAGNDWLGHVNGMGLDAIIITHAHPDHAGGLAAGTPCPVYATPQTHAALKRFPIDQRQSIRTRQPFRIGELLLEAFAVEHSILAPAVGYRLSAGGISIFYVPDLVFIRQRHAALTGVRLYIGDGATLTRSLVRRRGQRLIGHATVRTQLGWCAQEGVVRALITHCGSQIVTREAQALAELRTLAKQRGIRADFAFDGMKVVLRERQRPAPGLRRTSRVPR